MTYNFDIIFRRPDGREDIFTFYAKREGMNFLMELYSTLKRMEEYELSDVAKREGTYTLILKGPKIEVEFQQYVNTYIHYDQMVYSLISTLIFDTVEKIYTFQKGEKGGQTRNEQKDGRSRATD